MPIAPFQLPVDGPLRAPVRICFVCSGNICRSPTAEVVLREQAAAAGLSGLVEVSSAGTGGWHAGQDMDPRSRAALRAGGHDPGRHVARQFAPGDFADLDLVVALDGGHEDELTALADGSDASDPPVVRLRRFDPQLRPGEEPDVGDPYYGGESGFADVLDQITRSTAALLAAIERAVGGRGPSAQRQDDNDCL